MNDLTRNIYLGITSIVLICIMSFCYAGRKKVDVGQPAPELTGTNPAGETISLSSLKGKVVLLDFWASWCKPCRRSHPELVKAYQEITEEYPGKFTVFSVSLDDDKQRWVAAIQKDNLSWGHHICDYQGWKSPNAAAYGVESIPTSFLIDQKGKIVEKDVHGNQIKTFVKDLLQ